MSQHSRAMYFGILAITLWGTLALLSKIAGTIPPFQLLAITFSISCLISIFRGLILKKDLAQHLRQSPLTWLIGVGGLFGTHACYFIGLSLAPAEDITLIAYLWPLLLVLLSSCFTNTEPFMLRHIGGALLAFSGVILLVANDGADFSSRYLYGYCFAFSSALIWAGYSFATSVRNSGSSELIGWFCGGGALMALAFHLTLEQTSWPTQFSQWVAIAGISLGPVGLAFYAWDYGIRHGNIKMLATLSYGAPLISTILLVVFGEARADIYTFIACLSIVFGSVVAKFGLASSLGIWGFYKER